MPESIRGLWLITDAESAKHPVEMIAEAALRAGFRGVMVREKRMLGRPLLDLASRLSALCREYGASFVVNDRIDVALCLQGAGFHTGARGLPLDSARKLLGPDRPLGYSAHTAAEARAALTEGADYVSLSPVFPGITKPDAGPRGLDWFRRELATLSPHRVAALGGINEQNLPALRESGAGGALIMGALMQASDPEATARSLTRAWSGESPL